MRIFLLITLGLISCQNQKQESIGIFTTPNVENSFENAKREGFLKIPYKTTYNYLDSLGKKINPNKDYDYWGYLTKKESNEKTDLNNSTLSEGGNVKLKQKIDYGNNTIGFFQGGHPGFRCNYAVFIEDETITYVTTEEQFRDFLGRIDNLEEALLLARTFGYTLDNEGKTNHYKIEQDGYVLQLIKLPDHRGNAEMVEVRISQDAAIKTKSLGIYKSQNLWN